MLSRPETRSSLRPAGYLGHPSGNAFEPSCMSSNLQPHTFGLKVLVNDLKVRQNQPQGSNLAFKVRSSQNLRGSCRSRGGRCQGTNGNLYGIFSIEKSSVVMK